MKSKDVLKQLLPGIVVGLVLGFCLTMLVGVNTADPVPNYIGGAMACFIPTLLNCIIVLKGTAKHLDRKLSIGEAFLKTLPYALIALVIGFLTVFLIIEKAFGLNTCEIPVLATALYQAVLGVIMSTVSAYVALRSYESQVKYTRRKK